MLSTIRKAIAKALSTEIGVLGDDVKQIRADLNELALAHGSLFESFKRFQNKQAMRFARGAGGAGDGDLAAMLREALAAKKGNNADFPEF